jgi:hypothetical protein
LFAWALRPHVRHPHELPLFPTGSDFHSEVADPVLDRAVLPSGRFGGWAFSWLRLFQQGSIQAYLVYIFVVLMALLLWRLSE